MKLKKCITTRISWIAFGLIAAILLLTSCPGQISEENVLQVQDGEGPVITVYSPADGSSYASMVLVTGRVDDNTNGSESGKIKRLYYVVTPSAVSGSEIDVAGDGSFSFYFATDNFTGSIVISIMAEDWNNLSLLDEGAVPSFAAKPGNKSVILEWDDVPFAKQYTIYNMRYGEMFDNVTSPFKWTGLNNGELYSFRLLSHSSIGRDNWSDTRYAIPLSPVTLTPIVSSGYRKNKVEWHRIPGSTEYTLYRSISKETGYTVRAIASTNSFTDTGINPEQTYYYRVAPFEQEDIECTVNAAQPSMVTDEPWQIVGSVYGGSFDVRGMTQYGNYLYVAADTAGIQIYDISDPYNPSYAGGVSVSERVYDVAAQNGYIYAVSNSKFFVFSLEDPKNPVRKGSCSTNGPTLGLTVYGNRAYLADGTRLSIVDIDKKNAPAIIGTSQDSFAGNANDVVADANYVYMANGYDGFWIISTTSPYTTVGKIDHSDSAMQNCHRVAVSGNHAYVIAGQGYLYAINISDKANPQKKDSIDFSGNGLAEGITILGNQVWVADNQTDSIRIVDVSNEDDLVEIGSRLHGGRPKALVISGSYCCVAGSGFGLDIVHATFADPTVVHTWSMLYGASDFVISGNYAFVTEEDWPNKDYVRVIDITEHIDRIKGTIDVPGTEGGFGTIAACADHAYFTEWGLSIVDATDPSQPFICNTDDAGLDPDSIATLGDFGYMSSGTDLYIVDISDPTLPLITDTVSIPENIERVIATGDCIYVASHDWASHTFTLRAIDQYDPFYQVIHAGSSSMYSVNKCIISGDYMYVTTWEGGSSYYLKIIDLKDPNYQVIGQVDTGGSAGDIAISGVYAFLAKGSSGVQIINVSDPTNPFILKNVPVGGNVTSLEISGRYLYAIVDGNLAAIDLFAE
jgi:hypothetical protein